MYAITEHVARTERHTTFYLACGAADATPLIFVHGWPELSISWRHQLPVFAALGFRCVAPDMRGYGRSGIYPRHEDYALEHTVGDMIELLEALGRDKAVWVGHDWGSPVVWSLGSQHPDRCLGIVNLCVPYLPGGFAPAHIIPLVDRSVYPAAEFPAGQWEYQLFYEENFDKARSAFEVSVPDTVKALFRKGSPAHKGQPSRTAMVRRDGGWFGGRRTGAGGAAGRRRTDRGRSEQLRCFARAQRFLWPRLLVHEQCAQYCLRGEGAGQWPALDARAVPARRL